MIFLFLSLLVWAAKLGKIKINVGENRSVFIHVKKQNLVLISISGTKTDFQIYPENENDGKIICHEFK